MTLCLINQGQGLTLRLGKKKSKVVLQLYQLSIRHENVWGSGCRGPRLLDLGIRLRHVHSFKPRPLYSGDRTPLFPLVMKLRWLHSRSGHYTEEINLAVPGNRIRTLQLVASYYIDRAIPIPYKKRTSE
jgi:hypothetical protein